MSRRVAAVLLAGTVLWAASPALADDYGATVHAIDNVFNQQVVRIQPGQSVEWVNDGRAAHTATADDGSWDSGNLDPGQGFDHTFDQPGVYSFYCKYHGAPGVGMTGIVVVGDTTPLPGGGGDQVGPGREPAPTGYANTVKRARRLSDDPRRRRPREARRNGAHRPRRLHRAGHRHDAVRDDPRREPQHDDHRRRVQACERHPGDRGRRGRHPEHDRAQRASQRLLLEPRPRVLGLVSHRVQQRRLRHLRLRLRLRAVRPLLGERLTRFGLLHRAVQPVPLGHHRRDRDGQRRRVLRHERERRPRDRQQRVVRQPRRDRPEHARFRAAARRSATP